jgi:arylformamidase
MPMSSVNEDVGAVYRGMDRATLDAAYNNGRAVADSDNWLAKWRERSTKIRRHSGAKLNIAYGPKERQQLDYFGTGKADAPLFVFFHGGYWQRNDKDMFGFVAQGPRARGFDCAVVGYTLAPDASLTEIVDEINRAIGFLVVSKKDFMFDRKRLVVGGWSAGGHLAGIVAAHQSVCASLSISGIFDLEPISLNYLNDALKLTTKEVDELSPVKRSAVSKPMFLAAGELELPELRRQSKLYLEKVQAENKPISMELLPGHHHYSILDELFDEDGVLTRKLCELAN